MDWNSERIDWLKAMWRTGMSSGQIAAAFGKEGFPCTRNAVIGKVARMRKNDTALEVRGRRGKSHAPAEYAPPIVKPKPVRKPPPAPPPEKPAPTVFDTPAAPDSKRISLFDLGTYSCRWPIGEPGHADFGFCGADAPNQPYCLHHWKRAVSAGDYVKISERFAHR